MPRVSVVMSVYNTAQYLTYAIDSVLKQSFEDLELIVIDDGSTDRTPTILRQYRGSDGRIRHVRQNRLGFVESLNLGCQLAEGEYIARMDGDDISYLNRIEKQVSFLDKTPTVAVVGGAMSCIDEDGEPTGLVLRHATQDRAIKKTLLSGSSCIAHPTVMMRRDAIRAVKGYRKAFLHAEDYDLWLRMAERYDLANLPDILLSYRIHPNQVSFRRVEQQVLSTVAAQAAAKLRRSTGLDPLDKIQRVTRAMLIKLGVSALAIRDALAADWTLRATWMLHSARYKLANQLLARACEIDPNCMEHFAATYGYYFGYGGAEELSLLLGALHSHEEKAKKLATGNFYCGYASACFRDRWLLKGMRSGITACILQPALLPKSISWGVRQLLRRVRGSWI